MLCLTRPSHDAIFPLLTTGHLETWPLYAHVHAEPVNQHHLHTHLHLCKPVVNHKTRLIKLGVLETEQRGGEHGPVVGCGNCIKSGRPRFKSSSLPLDGFVLSGPEFNSSTLCKQPTDQPSTRRDS